MTTPPPMICISLRYADAPRMYDWLIAAFGFEKHAAYYSDDGKTLLHGELRLGDSFVSSITGRDYMVIMGTTIFLATLIITMNVIVDIVYKIIDPRIKLK